MVLLNRVIVVNSTPWSIGYWSADWMPPLRQNFICSDVPGRMARQADVDSRIAIAGVTSQQERRHRLRTCMPSECYTSVPHRDRAGNRKAASQHGKRTFKAA